jgi:hypothetical protein
MHVNKSWKEHHCALAKTKQHHGKTRPSQRCTTKERDNKCFTYVMNNMIRW